MSPRATPPASHPESGSALLLAIFVIALLVGIGSAVLFLGQNELSLSKSTNNEKAAFLLAEGGIEAGRMWLLSTNGAGSFSDDLATAAGANLVVNLNPGALRPIFNASGAVTGLTGAGDDAPLRPVTALGNAAAAGGSYAAFLTNDPVEGVGNQTDLNRRVMITGIGVDRTKAVEVAQAIIEPVHALPSVPTAALTLLGPPPFFDNGSSSAQSHTGTDCPGGGGIPGLFVPIVGTTGSTSTGLVESSMHRPENFTSGALTGAGTVGDLTNPADPALAQSSLAPIDPSWLDCNYLKQLVQDLIAAADFYCNTDSGSCTLPAGTPGQILVVDGNATAANFSSGLILVTGTLTYTGESVWNGIVLVIGEGRLVRESGGNGLNSGAVILANIDPSPTGLRANKSDWCSSGLGATYFEVNGGGNSTISYCSAYAAANNPVKTYRVTEFLQR